MLLFSGPKETPLSYNSGLFPSIKGAISSPLPEVTHDYRWYPLVHQSTCWPLIFLSITATMAPLTLSPSPSSPAHGFSIPSFSFLYNSTIFPLCSCLTSTLCLTLLSSFLGWALSLPLLLHAILSWSSPVCWSCSVYYFLSLLWDLSHDSGCTLHHIYNKSLPINYILELSFSQFM